MIPAPCFSFWFKKEESERRPVVSMGQVLPCFFFIQSTSFSESKYERMRLFYQLKFASLKGPTLAKVFADNTEMYFMEIVLNFV